MHCASQVQQASRLSCCRYYTLGTPPPTGLAFSPEIDPAGWS